MLDEHESAVARAKFCAGGCARGARVLRDRTPCATCRLCARQITQCPTRRRPATARSPSPSQRSPSRRRPSRLSLSQPSPCIQTTATSRRLPPRPHPLATCGCRRGQTARLHPRAEGRGTLAPSSRTSSAYVRTSSRWHASATCCVGTSSPWRSSSTSRWADRIPRRLPRDRARHLMHGQAAAAPAATAAGAARRMIRAAARSLHAD